MIHLESLICYSCQTTSDRNLFDDKNRKPVSGDCGHSICLQCYEDLNPNKNCPICREQNAFSKGTINYGAKNMIEYFTENAFDVFRKWWETLETGIGTCSKCSSIESLRICLTCQKAQNWKDINLEKYAKCEKCAEEAVKRTSRSGCIHQCNKTGIREKLGNTPNLQCRWCHNPAPDPYLCTTCFHNSTININVDTFSLCADCIIDHHSGHETSKAMENFSIRHSTVTIVEKILLRKIESLKKKDGEMKCKLRHLRMELTGKEAIYRASTCYPLWAEEDAEDPKLIGRPKIPTGYVKNVLNSLETQFSNLQNLEAICPCVDVWKEVKRLKIFDQYGNPPHFLAMVNKPDLGKVLEGCPYELEENRGLKEKLAEIIWRGEVLTESHEQIFADYPPSDI